MALKQSPRRKWTIKPWPYPGDSREDKAKRVAVSYREVVQRIAQGEAINAAFELYLLDQQWASHGIYWPNPPDDLIDPDEWLTAADMAHLTDRTPADIYRWARRGNIQQRLSADGSPEYHVASAIAYQHKQRQRRQG